MNPDLDIEDEIKDLIKEEVIKHIPKDGVDGIQGEKGEAGKDGKNGKDGRDGRDGELSNLWDNKWKWVDTWAVRRLTIMV